MHELVIPPQVEAIIKNRESSNYIRVDRAFSWLLFGQWIFGIVAAWFISPYTWQGDAATIHPHVWAAIFLGGAICLFPIAFSRYHPGTVASRQIIAVAQMSFSSLLIHVLGGRIEAHFHIFGSLAFLAYYRNIPVLITASAVVIADHILRGYFYPVSIYGVLSGAEWRWAEHTAWVLFEDAFLIVATKTIRHETKKSAIYEYQLIKEREKALELSEIKTRFLSNMSHEIRTPLNSIIGFSDLLRATPLDNDQGLYVSTIYRCSESLLSVVNDVLDLNKIESGHLEIENQPFSITELKNNLLEIFQPQSRQKGLGFSIVIEGEWPPHVIGDFLRLRQIMINLIGNALKFTERGSVQVRFRRDSDGRAHFQVRDTGIGIKPENIEKIFGPFNQEDASVSRRFGGTGLGLTICKSLVEQMNGSMKVVSDYGRGATFSFELSLPGMQSVEILPSRSSGDPNP